MLDSRFRGNDSIEARRPSPSLTPLPQFPDTSPDPTQRLIAICRRVGADTYLSGAGGQNYLAPAEFEKAGIKLEFQRFEHPVYPQYVLKPRVAHGKEGLPALPEPARELGQGAGFIPCLSAIDGLFNCGGGAAGRKMLNIETHNEKEALT